MAVDPDSVGFFGKFADWILTGVSAVVMGTLGLVKHFYKTLSERVKKLEEEAVMKDAFNDFSERAETTRTELRDGIIGLHSKIDGLVKILLEHK